MIRPPIQAVDSASDGGMSEQDSLPEPALYHPLMDRGWHDAESADPELPGEGIRAAFPGDGAHDAFGVGGEDGLAFGGG